MEAHAASLEGRRAMIMTPLDWQLSGGVSSLLLGGIPIMELQQKEGKAPLLFFHCFPVLTAIL